MKLVSFLALSFCLVDVSHADCTNWQSFPTVAATTAGASYSLSIPFSATSDFSSYWVYVVDTVNPEGSGGAGEDGTQTTSIQIKDSSNNNVCSTPTSSHTTLGSATVYSDFQDCSSGTLTAGNEYTVNLTGKAYHYDGGTQSGLVVPMVNVCLAAQ